MPGRARCWTRRPQPFDWCDSSRRRILARVRRGSRPMARSSHPRTSRGLPPAPHLSTDSRMTNEPNQPTGDGSPTPAAIAATENPVQLTVGLIEDERIPEGMVCMGSYRNGRLVARSVIPPEAWTQIREYGIFSEPVQVV